MSKGFYMSTILELFGKLQQMDEDLIAFEFEEHKELLNQTREKITAYHEVRSRIMHEQEETMQRFKSLKDKYDRLGKQMERIDNYLIMACKSFDVTSFPGNNVTMKLISQKRIKPKYEPSGDFHTRFPDYCKEQMDVDYKWDREKLIEDFKRGDHFAKELAEEYTTQYLRFNV